MHVLQSQQNLGREELGLVHLNQSYVPNHIEELLSRDIFEGKKDLPFVDEGVVVLHDERVADVLHHGLLVHDVLLDLHLLDLLLGNRFDGDQGVCGGVKGHEYLSELTSADFTDDLDVLEFD